MLFEHDYTTNPELTNSQIDTFGFSSPHEQITSDFKATCVKVHDGDTITLRCDFRDFDFPLRFANIDAPELSEGGSEARDWLKGEILNQDVEIKINKQNRVGKFGRLIGQVFYNGLDLGEAELQLGLAVPFGKKKEGEVPIPDKIFDLEQWF